MSNQQIELPNETQILYARVVKKGEELFFFSDSDDDLAGSTTLSFEESPAQAKLYPNKVEALNEIALKHLDKNFKTGIILHRNSGIATAFYLTKETAKDFENGICVAEILVSSTIQKIMSPRIEVGDTDGEQQ